MIETSNALAHASFSFTVAAPIMVLCGHGADMAFIAGITSMLMDLDSTLSPSSRYQHAMHSPYAFAVALSLPMIFSAMGLDPYIATLVPVAVATHLLQDLLSGEIELDAEVMYGIGGILFRPKMSRVFDIACIPSALVIMLL